MPLWTEAAELPQRASDGRHTSFSSLQLSVSAAQSARGKAAQFLRHDLA
jgi:hypothetical protein